MSWERGEYSDFFTAAERRYVTEEVEPLFPGYLRVLDFDEITIDGACSYETLRQIVIRLGAMQKIREDQAGDEPRPSKERS